MTLKERINDSIGRIVTKFNTLSQDENASVAIEHTITEGAPELLRRAASEGAVLLKNDNILPLQKGTTVSLFGRTYKDYFYVGYGSGGDVNRPYSIDLNEGIRNCAELNINESLCEIYDEWVAKNPVSHGYWAHWPLRYAEMPLTDEIVSDANKNSDVAVVTIGRSSGEDRDCDLANGSYFLHDEEIEMLDKVCAHFDKVVVLLNVGNIIDMSWVKHYGDKIGAIMYVWQGGMESGNAIADLLCGRVSPCGKLVDTIAKKYEDNPSSQNYGAKLDNIYAEDIYVGYRYFETFDKEKVLYPFGFGLSYTNFEISVNEAKHTENGFEINARVKNIGEHEGKEAVQLYLAKPCGRLGNPARILCAFAKTKTLAPNEEQDVTLKVDMYQLASYDDCGSTNNAGCYVIERGDYKLYIGNDVRASIEALAYYQDEDCVVAKHKQACAPKHDFEHMFNENGVLKTKHCAKEKYDLASRILNNLPEDIEQTGDKGYKLTDVKDGKVTMDEFVAQLSLDELEAITRGDYEMNSKYGAAGNAGAYGGILDSLTDKGIPAVITTDGPSGIRLQASCSLLPIGTLLGCTFDEELCFEVYSKVAKEMKEKGSDVLLAPGMNIHRNTLCGRNFEYFSEDPYLTGKLASATVKGIQNEGASACPKHFACNNQEFKRVKTNTVISERALREIYLKGFEICIKEAEPKNIMTSYNKINGVWNHYNYDLCTTILRGEWGYKGNVMTDWWMQSSKSQEFPIMKDQAYRVRAQVDLLMPGGDRATNRKPDGTLLASYGKTFGITLGEMQRSAKNILQSVIEIKM